MATVANSCSTMHKIHEKEFTLDDFSCENLMDDRNECWNEDIMSGPESCQTPLDILRTIVDTLNVCRNKFCETKDKKYWWQMIQLLPSSYNQTRNVMMNYEVLCNIYKSRKSHRLDEWREFCKWAETLPYSELIVGSESLRCVEIGKAAADGIQKSIKDHIFPFKDNYKED